MFSLLLLDFSDLNLISQTTLGHEQFSIVRRVANKQRRDCYLGKDVDQFLVCSRKWRRTEGELIALHCIPHQEALCEKKPQALNSA